MLEQYFDCTDLERAIFETGIKLGSVFHQYIGNTFRKEDKGILEKAMEASLLAQPYCIDAKVSITPDCEGDYCSLTDRMIHATIIVRINEIEVKGFIEYIQSEHYPLIYFRKHHTALYKKV